MDYQNCIVEIKPLRQHRGYPEKAYIRKLYGPEGHCSFYDIKTGEWGNFWLNIERDYTVVKSPSYIRTKFYKLIYKLKDTILFQLYRKPYYRTRSEIFKTWLVIKYLFFRFKVLKTPIVCKVIKEKEWYKSCGLFSGFSSRSLNNIKNSIEYYFRLSDSQIKFNVKELK